MKVLASLAAVLVSLSANAADLNRPIQDRPNVATEIERGWRAAFECGLTNTGNYSGMSDCVSDEGKRAEQQHTDAKPFLLGLYAGATYHFSIGVNAGGPMAADDQKGLELSAPVYVRLRSQLRISDEQVVSTLSDLNDLGKRRAIEALSSQK